MAQFSYNRSYNLILEEPIEVRSPEDNQEGTEENPIDSKATKSVIRDDLSSEQVTSVKIEGLQIKATIVQTEKTQGSNPTSNSIEIYNLSKSTRDKVAKKNALVILNAGYSGDVKQVFTGQVSRPDVYREGTNVITKLWCEDGYSPIRSVNYSKSFGKGTPYTTIFEDIISAFNDNGIARDSNGIILNKASKTTNKNNIPSELTTERTWSHSGFLFEALDKLCEQFDYKWQILFSRLYIYPADDDEMVGVAVVNEDNILSLRENEETSEKSSSQKTPVGIKITTLLDGNINSVKLLKVESNGSSRKIDRYTGTYRVVSVKHELDYEGQSWYTTVECEGLKE